MQDLVNCDVLIDNFSFTSFSLDNKISEIRAEIEEEELYLEQTKRKILVGMAQPPREIRDEEGSILEWEDHVVFLYGETMNSLEESLDRLTRLNLILTQLLENKRNKVEELNELEHE